MPIFSHKRTVFLFAIIGGVLIWNHHREADQTSIFEPPRPLPKVVASPPPSPVETPSPAKDEIPVPPAPSATTIPAAASPAPSNTSPPVTQILPGSVNEIPAAAEDISEDLSAVFSAIGNFQAVHGENPVGSNAEITSALLGNNLKQIKLEVPAGSHVNGEGEMCDRWGSPYFFHQVSATKMEIRSAGPDRRMWTGDDSQM